jgi:hypothetical protein
MQFSVILRNFDTRDEKRKEGKTVAAFLEPAVFFILGHLSVRT